MTSLTALLVAPFTDFAFMQRALIAVLAVSVGAAPIGVFLMLRRMSLTGDAIAHGLLPGVAVGYLISGLSVTAMTMGGFIAGLAVALLSGLITRLTPQGEDTNLAAFYLVSLASGVLIIAASGSSVDLLHVLFGSILALDDEAVRLLVGIAAVSLLVLALIRRPLILECVDPTFLRTVSRLGPVAHFSFLALAVLTMVGGFHALGTLMAVGTMILPAAISRYWSRRLGGMIVVAVLASALGGVTGLVLSFHNDWPTGPTIILVLGGLYLFSLAFGRVGSLAALYWPKPHLEH